MKLAISIIYLKKKHLNKYRNNVKSRIKATLTM